MKKFIMILVLGMVFGACGTDPGECVCDPAECTCDPECTECIPEKDNFFKEYYSECFDHCTLCAQWATACDFFYPQTICVDTHWYFGIRLSDCEYYSTLVREWVKNNDCESYLIDFDACAFRNARI